MSTPQYTPQDLLPLAADDFHYKRPDHFVRPSMIRASAVVLALLLLCVGAQAQGSRSDKLLLTGGLSQLEGAAGGGLTPWAVIGGYGTKDQIGASAAYTLVNSDDFRLEHIGILVGVRDRVELSLARQHLDTQDSGALLGLGRGFRFQQDIFGLKVRLAGDAVLEQDSWLPQLAFGVQHKRNDQRDTLKALGASSASGTDFYLSATKLYLDTSMLLSATVRLTRANQLGLLGFGGAGNTHYRPQLEGSIAWLLRRDLAIGAEYRSKPDNLDFARENDWFDAFITWAPNKNLALTLAWADLGDIATIRNQRGAYLSVQLGF
jgi:Protein of unknown function (DUF3034)